MLSKEYRPIDSDIKRVYNLSGHTARTEKALKSLKLLYDETLPPEERWDPDKEFDNILKAGGQPFVDMCNILFKGVDKFTINDAEDIDKSIVREAMLDFFYRDFELMRKYNDSYLTSVISKINQTKDSGS